MRWVILALWVIMTIINLATGGIGSRDIYCRMHNAGGGVRCRGGEERHMSILIEGIELPKENQRGLWVVIHADGTVEYDSGDEGWKALKQAAYSVPPHGRLIDADALEYYADNVRDPMGRTEKTVMWKKIEAAPTIIPPEEAGSHERCVYQGLPTPGEKRPLLR